MTLAELSDLLVGRRIVGVAASPAEDGPELVLDRLVLDDGSRIVFTWRTGAYRRAGFVVESREARQPPLPYNLPDRPAKGSRSG